MPLLQETDEPLQAEPEPTPTTERGLQSKPMRPVTPSKGIPSRPRRASLSAESDYISSEYDIKKRYATSRRTDVVLEQHAVVGAAGASLRATAVAAAKTERASMENAVS